MSNGTRQTLSPSRHLLDSRKRLQVNECRNTRMLWFERCQERIRRTLLVSPKYLCGCLVVCFPRGGVSCCPFSLLSLSSLRHWRSFLFSLLSFCGFWCDFFSLFVCLSRRFVVWLFGWVVGYCWSVAVRFVIVCFFVAWLGALFAVVPDFLWLICFVCAWLLRVILLGVGPSLFVFWLWVFLFVFGCV